AVATSCQKDQEDVGTVAATDAIQSASGVSKLAATSSSFVRRTEGQRVYNLTSLKLKTIKQYLGYIPPGYNSQPTKKWPLVINLHGSSETGTDANKIFWTYFAWSTIDKKRPYILITPQLLTGNSAWNAADLDKLIATITPMFNVDPNRIVITGYSMGGHGAWDLAEYNPGRYAGVLAIAGWGNTASASKMKNLPAWAHHGDKDQYVAYKNSVNMINAIKSSGGSSASLKTYYGRDHFIHSTVYDDNNVINWILARRR
ncbi:MAG: dienelactone hydrolase family protein, partial [Mucilaginibacter polytrichastri]|nr:dienelactone hydrolase family protein [Mucilaginibacter polytrichastri]